MKVLITDDYMEIHRHLPSRKKNYTFFRRAKKKGFFPYILAKIR